MPLIKKYSAPIFLLGICITFFWKVFVYGLLPIPSDTIVGLYHPYRDFYASEYPNGIPYRNYIITDPVRQQYPWRKEVIDQIKVNTLPLWNQYSYLGTPLLANIQSAALYPLNLLFYFGEFEAIWTFLIILQPILGSVFMYLYLRNKERSKMGSLLGSLVYAFGGFAIAWMEWNTVLHVTLWLPLILYLIDTIIDQIAKGANTRFHSSLLSILLIIALVSSLLAGHPQMAFYAVIVYISYFIVQLLSVLKMTTGGVKRRRFLLKIARFFLPIVIISILIASIQWIPFLILIAHSARGADRMLADQEGWFIPIQHLIQYVAPDFFGNPAKLNYWGIWNYGEMVGYVGVIPLILSGIAIVGKKTREEKYFIVASALALVFATDNILARVPFILHIPLLSTAQPTRLLFIIHISLSVLAAYGLDTIFKNAAKKTYIAIVGSIAILYMLLWIFVFWGRTYLQGDDWTMHLDIAKRNLILPTGIFIVFVLLLFALSIIRTRKLFNKKYTISIIGAFIIVITVFDLFRFGWWFTPFTNPSYLYPQTYMIQFLEKQERPFRFMSMDSRILPPNFSGVYGIETVSGYDPVYSKLYAQFASAWIKGKPDTELVPFNRIVEPTDAQSKLADLLNVQYVASFDELDSEKLVKVFEEGSTKLYKNMTALPRAYFVDSVETAKNDNDAIHKLFTTTFDVKKKAVILKNISLTQQPVNDQEYVTITNYSPNRIEMSTKTDIERLLVVSNLFYPTWHASIDNKPTEIYQTDYVIQGVVVPQGEHTVTLTNTLL